MAHCDCHEVVHNESREMDEVCSVVLSPPEGFDSSNFGSFGDAPP